MPAPTGPQLPEGRWVLWAEGAARKASARGDGVATTPVTAHWPLVGRATEMVHLRRCLRGPLPGGVLLTGAAGVGKSRLLAELADLAASAGHAVEWVSGAACGDAVPLGAMVQLISEVPTGDIDPARFLIVCRELLVEHHRGRRLFLAVDDVPRVDAESAAFFAQLLVLGCALVAFTSRTEDPLPSPLASLCKDGLLSEVVVPPLEDRQVEELVRRVLGGQVGTLALGRLVEAAGGNPLFLRELVTQEIESGQLVHVDGVWQLVGPLVLSTNLRRLISARLERLLPSERETLELMAVAGPLELAIAGRLCGLPALESLERRDLTRVLTEGRRRMVGFKHPLYLEAVLNQIPASGRVAICGRLVDAVAETGARRRGDPLRLAQWHMASGHPVSPDVLTAAAWRARTAGDDDLAERMATAALAAGAGDEATLVRAEAMARLGRCDEAAGMLAAIEARSGGDRLGARAAVGRARIAWMVQSDSARAIAILQAARRDMPEPQSQMILSGDLVLLRAFATAEPGRALEEALALVDDLRAPDEARLQAITVAQLISNWLGRFPLAYTLAARGRKLAETAAPQLREAGARLSVAEGMAMTYDGRLPEAIAQLSEGYHRGLKPPMDGYAAVWGTHLGLALAISGRLHDATLTSYEALVLTPTGDVPNHLGSHAAMAAIVAGQANDLAGLRRSLDIVNGCSWFPPPARAWAPMAAAWEAWRMGNFTGAGKLAQQATAAALEDGNLLAAAWACHHALEFGHPEEAVGQLREIAEESDSVAFDTWARHAVALARGDAFQLEAIGDEYRDRQEFLHAVQGYVQAAGCFQDGRGDLAAARLLAKARFVAAATGQLQAWLPPELPGQLTAREAQVATMAATGLTSREIADRLFVSVRTVDNHLAAIFSKLGIHHRTDLSRLFYRS